MTELSDLTDADIQIAPASSEISLKDRPLVDRYFQGASQSEIGREFGLTRERVRQRLEKYGIKGRNYHWIPDKTTLLDALSTAASFEDAAVTLQLNELRLSTAVSYHGASAALSEARDRWRAHHAEVRRRATQQVFLRQIQRLALEVKHTPTQGELRRRGVHHVELDRAFGSVPNAMRAAGLIPNQTGRPPAPLPPAFLELDLPTADREEAYRKAEAIRRIHAEIPEPAGSERPRHVTISTAAYYRDPRVVAWVLRFADGTCEACGMRGYETDSGVEYLEVHHVVPLSSGGPDTIWNAVAVCETCHGRLHRWKNRKTMEDLLYLKLRRLRRPSG